MLSYTTHELRHGSSRGTFSSCCGNAGICTTTDDVQIFNWRHLIQSSIHAANLKSFSRVFQGCYHHLEYGNIMVENILFLQQLTGVVGWTHPPALSQCKRVHKEAQGWVIRRFSVARGSSFCALYTRLHVSVCSTWIEVVSKWQPCHKFKLCVHDAKLSWGFYDSQRCWSNPVMITEASVAFRNNLVSSLSHPRQWALICSYLFFCCGLFCPDLETVSLVHLIILQFMWLMHPQINAAFLFPAELPDCDVLMHQGGTKIFLAREQRLLPLCSVICPFYLWTHIYIVKY